VLIVGAIATIQHFTPLERTHWHYIFPRVYYLPIVFAALYDGWRGGLGIAFLSSAAFLQQFLVSDDVLPERLINRYLELVSFCTLAVLTGFAGYTGSCSADFATGRGGLLQLLGASLSSCCRYRPARVSRRIGQFATCHAAFALPTGARPLR
jgi:hypothetical protein